MKKLYFVRHGQTDTNIKGLFSGHIEAKLTKEGKEQAVATGKELKTNHQRIDLIICSPQIRAFDTACLIAKELGYPIKHIQKNPRFKERYFGVLEGTSATHYMKESKKYQDVDSAEGAETIAMLQKRAEQALEYVKKLTDKNILIVSHGAFGRAFRRAVNGQPHTDEYVGDLKIINNSEIVELF